MDQAIKEQWVAALRSGEYEQGQARLVTITPAGEKFCCLGVLCDLAVKSGLDLAIEDEVALEGEDGSLIEGRRTYDDVGGVLPLKVVQWADLMSATGAASRPDDDEFQVYVGDDGTLSLAGMNDNGYTFDEIACRIERYL